MDGQLRSCTRRYEIRLCNDRVPRGIEYSHVITGNSEGFDSSGGLVVGRSGTVSGPARSDILCRAPSSLMKGHSTSEVIARAMIWPSAPSSTQAAMWERLECSPRCSSASWWAPAAMSAVETNAQATTTSDITFPTNRCITSSSGPSRVGPRLRVNPYRGCAQMEDAHLRQEKTGQRPERRSTNENTRSPCCQGALVIGALVIFKIRLTIKAGGPIVSRIEWRGVSLQQAVCLHLAPRAEIHAPIRCHGDDEARGQRQRRSFLRLSFSMVCCSKEVFLIGSFSGRLNRLRKTLYGREDTYQGTTGSRAVKAREGGPHRLL